jgi:branched-chain amino acid transport system ATP-binding protein
MLTALLGTSPAVFLAVTVILVGGAAVLAGRAIGGSWKPAWQVVAACFGLALADRFLTFALFEGELLSLGGLVLSFAVLVAMGLASWRFAQVGKLVGQYPWRYRRTSPFSYTELNNG